MPITISNAGGASYYGTDTSRASFAPGATVATAILHGSPETRTTQYFNTAAFTGSGTTYGNTSRNMLVGPISRDFDLSLNKQTRIAESVMSEFRAQAFNITNTPSFANPSSDEGTASTFGVISNTVGNPRILQFVLKISF